MGKQVKLFMTILTILALLSLPITSLYARQNRASVPQMAKISTWQARQTSTHGAGNMSSGIKNSIIIAVVMLCCVIGTGSLFYVYTVEQEKNSQLT